jgi:cell division protein FtsQ
MNPGNRRVAGLEEPPASRRPGSRASIPAPGPKGGQRAARVLAGLRTLVGVALVAGTSLGVAWVARRHIMTSPRFAIASVDVSGNEHRATDALVAESGLAVGTNVFVADLDAAQARVLADPWISEATLSRRLPGTILVHVTERKAAALAALGDTYVTTAEGDPFKKLDPSDPPDVTSLPLVTGLRPEALADDREGATRTIRRAIDLAAEFARTPLAKRAPLQEVHVEADGAFSLVVGRSGMQLVLGAPPFRRKLDQAVRVVAELDRRGAKADSIMLDNDTRPDRVVVRMR